MSVWWEKGWQKKSWYDFSGKMKTLFFGGFNTLGQIQLFIQKFPGLSCLKNMNFVKNHTLKMWILWKITFRKCELCEKSHLENVNFVKNHIFRVWFLWKISLWKCEFCEKSHFENVNFWINCGFWPQCVQ